MTEIVQYNGHRIVVNPDYTFSVLASDDDDGGRDDTFDTMAKAKEFVDKRVKSANAIKQKALALPMLFFAPIFNGHGYNRTQVGVEIRAAKIRGIHASRGRFLLVDKDEEFSGGWSTPDAYVDHPHVRGLMTELIAARAVVKKLEEDLMAFFLREYSGRSSPEELAKSLNKLELDHAAKFKKAEEAK